MYKILTLLIILSTTLFPSKNVAKAQSVNNTATIFFEGEVTSETVRDIHLALENLRVNFPTLEKVYISITSSGGSTNSVQHLNSVIRNYPIPIHTHNMSNTFSAAASILCAGDTRTASRNTLVMFHYPFFGNVGAYGESGITVPSRVMEIRSRMLESNMSKCTNLDDIEIKNSLQKEITYDPNEALEIDLIQRIGVPTSMFRSCIQFFVVEGTSSEFINNCPKSP